MKIGIDIDGVLTDEHTFIIDNATKFFSENNIPYEVNKDIYDNARIFNVTEDEYILFWKQYFLNYIKNVTIRPYASEIIKKLKEDNHEIFIITARPFTSYDNEYKEQMQSIAKEWLNKNGVLYDQCVLLTKIYQPLTCFISYSKSKLACFSGISTPCFCIPIP